MHYLQRLATALQQLENAPGTFATVHVQHDSHCPMLVGKPDCRCVPTILIDRPVGRIEVLPNGSLRHSAESN